MNCSRFKALTLILTLALAFTPLFYVFNHVDAAESLDASKMNEEFYNEVSSDDGSLYYDVIMVFNQKSSTEKLDVFGREYKTYKVLPMARMLLNKEELTTVTNWSEVKFVEPNHRLTYFNAEGRVMTKAEQVQNELGYTGSNVEVAIIDTGADGLHPDLDDNMLYNWQVVGDLDTMQQKGYVSSTPDGIDVQTSVIDASLEAGGPVNTDEYGHGTHVFGTIAGTGEASEGHYRGMAPKSKVHSYSTSAGLFLVYTTEAYDHIMWQVQQGNADIKVVSNSWGTDGCEFEVDNVTNTVTRLAYEMGILSVFAYGNSGPDPNTCNPYATAPYVLGIAATDKDYKIAGFSSRGKLEANYDREEALNNLYEYLNADRETRKNWDKDAKPLGIFRPSISAPGVGIVSAQNPAHPMTTSGTYYGAASGTSMATPHVSGISALVIDAYQSNHPNKELTPIDIIRLLEVTANKEIMFGYDTHDTGAGFVDAYAAVQQAIADDIPTAVTSADLVDYQPPANVTVESKPYSGTVLANSWETDTGYGVHEIEVKEGALKIYADVSWASDLEKVYIGLYEPGKDVVNDEPSVESAGLLDITKTRYVEFNFPKPGIWKVRIDGRVNTATDYEGHFEVHYEDNVNPQGSVSVTPTKISEDEPVDIYANVNDADGTVDLSKVSLVVEASNGKVIGAWSKDDFTVVDDNTLKLTTLDFKLTNNAPWLVKIEVEDSAGNYTYDQAFIGRE